MPRIAGLTLSLSLCLDRIIVLGKMPHKNGRLILKEVFPLRLHVTILNIIRILSAIAIISMVIISVAVYHTDVFSLLVFLSFILLYVQFPGFLILRLLRIRSGHISADLLLSFFAGWALADLVYFISAGIGTRFLLYTFGPIMSAIWIWLSFHERTLFLKRKNFSPARIPAGLYLAVVIFMAYILLTTQYLYMAPDYSRYIYASIDKVYQMGLISSLSNGYPLVNPWVAGRTVHYHIFTQVLFSIPVSLFGLTVDFAEMSCNPLMTTYLLCLSLYALFRCFCRHKERAGLYTLSIALSHMFIARGITSSYLFRVLLTNDNYGGTAVAGAIALIVMLDIFLRSDEIKPAFIGQASLLTLLTMLLSGIKAPVGLVMAGAMIGTSLLGIILRRIDRRRILATLLVSIGFSTIYLFLMDSDATSGVDGESVFSFGKVTGLCFWKPDLIAYLEGIGIPSKIRLICILLVFAVSFFTIYLLPFTIGYLRELVLVLQKRKDYDFTRVSVYAAAIVGFVLMMFLRYSGHSQIYFGTVLFAFAPLIAFWFFEDVGKDSVKWMKALWRLSTITFFLAMIVTTATLAGSFIRQAPEAIKHANPESKYNKYKSMSAEEYEAIKWIRNNTDKDALFATQMYASVKYDAYDYTNRWHSCHFSYASYSGRRFYLEGSGFTFTDSENNIRNSMLIKNKRLFDPDDDSRGDTAHELGVDYVLVTKRLHPIEDLSSGDYKRVFSNNDVDIYEITK